MRVYLARHGQSQGNRRGVYRGWTDEPLTDLGRKQAIHLGKVLEPVTLDAIISSPLSRARNTALVVAQQKNLQIKEEKRLKELHFGKWENRHYLDIQKEEPEDFLRWTKDWEHTPPPKGESFQDLSKRVSACFDALLAGYQKKNVLIVAHQGSLSIMAALLLNRPANECWHFAFESGACSLIEVQEGYGVMKKMNETGVMKP